MSKFVFGDARNDSDLLQLGKFGVIVADPPWLYRVAKGEGTAKEQYDLLTDDDLLQMPIGDLAADNCILFLWGTWPKLPEAMAVMRAWGFEYITGLPWVKLTKGSNGPVLSYGVGYWVRGCSEYVLIGRCGNVSPPRQHGYLGILSPNLHHSRKPDSIHELAETLPGPYLELFARRPRVNWTTFGNEKEEDLPLFRKAAPA